MAGDLEAEVEGLDAGCRIRDLGLFVFLPSGNGTLGLSETRGCRRLAVEGLAGGNTLPPAKPST